MRKAFFKGLLGGLLVLAGQGHAGEIETLEVKDAWLRAAPPVASSMAGYLTITNAGAQPRTVVGITSDFAGHVMLHETVTREDGTRAIRHLHRLTVAPGETVTLAPGGKHLMFMDLKRVPGEGETVQICFDMEVSTDCEAFPVRKAAPSDH